MARKILLADDSVTAQNMGRKILADAGYEVCTVNNGSAALKRVNDSLPDIVVLDVYMPGYSGLEICQHLKESSNTAHIPVLLTVGKLEPFKPDEARRVRADAYIVKPFEASELLSAVAHLEDIAAASDRPKTSTKGAGKGSLGKKVSSESEGGSWRSALGVPDAPKNAAAPESAFHDFRRSSGSQAGKPPAAQSQPQEEAPVVPAPVIPELPRDITPDELDALSAVAARLDSAGPSQVEAPVKETAAAAAQTAADTTSVAPISIQELTQVTAARFLQDPAAVADKTDEPLFAAAPLAEQEEREQKSAEKMATPDAAAATNQSVAAAASAGTSTAASETRTADLPQPAKPEPEAQKLGESKSEAPTETAEPLNVTPVPEATNVEPASTVPELAEAKTAGSEKTGEQEEGESAAPSEEEIAEALRLLTPARGSSEPPAAARESGETGSPAVQTVCDLVSSPRWIAEPVALTPEEASQSLEAEMFGAALEYAVRENGIAPAGDEDSGGNPATETPAVEVTSQTLEEAPAAAQEPVCEIAGEATAQSAGVTEESACPEDKAEGWSTPEQTAPATFADLPVPESAEPIMAAAAGESTIAQQAVELALAEQAAAGDDANRHEAPKAMAAAATTDGVSATAPDPAAIASIVESVLADLRPKIVEEITKKLTRR